MNGGILVGGFFRIAFVLSMRKREKISETSGENPEVFITSDYSSLICVIFEIKESVYFSVLVVDLSSCIK